ncbi:MAG TPA: adenylate/guanylate cyclase domain-containing protein [Ramlibacter sp.]|uniref:CHASE2 domain-containing protein n=1 Tax=Ramlibacter sp. TaxID=1917967 RepID=UPI002BB6FCEC|nr:adenylate/guanylate cyclase domain-containing protein [Ramlibacter sp.]HVZ45646.1 adenylate/guanylate cyclase domain-containing protein [Ramlibacter sp.]
MLIQARPGMQAVKLAAACGLFAWALGFALMFLRPWTLVELKLFDLMTVATAPGKSSLPITIVGIDEASFTQLGKRWPWPRDMHAKLLDRLHAAGAGVIAFDLLFPETSAPAEDQAMAEAIRRAGNVVLASDYAFHETASMREFLRVDPVQPFTEAGALSGLTTVDLDQDAVIRAMPRDAEAFWRQTVRALLKARPGLVPDPYVPPGALIRHLGPARTFPYVSYYQVLNGDPAIPKDFFADQIVLVGKDVRASLEATGTGGDLLATPFLLESNQLTPGVEVQATILENALMGQTIVPASFGRNAMVMTLAVLLAIPALLYWQPLRSGAAMLVLGAALSAVTVWLFKDHGQWQYAGTPLAALLAGYLATGTGSYLTEKRRATQIRSAFSKYVSSDVVNRIISSPESLKLGGERRELTVLFTDLAGFTTVSEKLAPEAVAELVNTYLNEVTGVIMKHGGTVDKYVGDAAMAFWNAPLDDPKHALHAVQAAIEMQEAMDKLQPRFRALGVEKLSMRVGVHSGPAIVGNMGSDLRFDYTALGDTVNLASRLEGANKHYGTRILLSASTAAALSGAVRLRQVDRIRVKGKTVAVDVFTPCADAKLAAATDEAWKAYVAADWEAAERAWVRVQAIAPDDTVARVFLARIAKLLTLSLALDWDAATALE